MDDDNKIPEKLQQAIDTTCKRIKEAFRLARTHTNDSILVKAKEAKEDGKP